VERIPDTMCFFGNFPKKLGLLSYILGLIKVYTKMQQSMKASANRFTQFKDLDAVMAGKKPPSWAPVELQLENKVIFYLPLENFESFRLTNFP